jgi:S1-C subfamily serine protease
MESAPPRSPPRTPPRGLIVGLIVVLTGVLGYRLITLMNRAGAAATERPVVPRGDLSADEAATIAIFKENASSVVYITTKRLTRDRFSARPLEIPEGTGSGFIWDTAGHIVTNFHVIEQSVTQPGITLTVTLHDQNVYRAEVIGAAPDKDIAVLSIDAPADVLRPIPIGRSSDLAVGQKVFAIGNPFGFDHTLTTGVISGLDREIQSVTRRPITGVIQTDAAINPGNSGGPLIDSAGRLIGMNTAIYSPSGAYAGIGFAVPVDSVNRIVPQLVTNGRIVQPGLGVRIAGAVHARRQGVVIADVAEGSAAARAGLRGIMVDDLGRAVYGDIITAVGDAETHTVEDIYRALDGREVGDEVILTVDRQGAEMSVKVQLQAID